MLRKFVGISLILSLLVSSLVLVSSNVSAAGCSRITVRFEATRDTTLGGRLTVRWYLDGEQLGSKVFDDIASLGTIPLGTSVVIGTITVQDVDEDDLAVGLGRSTIVVGGGTFTATVDDCTSLQDGRLNAYDAGALAIIYTNSGQGYDIYTIDPVTSDGDLVLQITRAEVNAARDAALAPGGANTLIDSYNDITLWALNSGECQMNALNGDGSLYEFIFNCAV
jgi:hypothetical protein